MAHTHIQINKQWVGEMAQQLTLYTALAEDPEFSF